MEHRARTLRRKKVRDILELIIRILCFVIFFSLRMDLVGGKMGDYLSFASH